LGVLTCLFYILNSFSQQKDFLVFLLIFSKFIFPFWWEYEGNSISVNSVGVIASDAGGFCSGNYVYHNAFYY
jgi:hypothetical protein